MKTKVLLIINLIFSIVCLLISMKIFWNIGIFVDENNLSPDIVLGGKGWLIMSWIRLGLISIVSIITLILLILRFKKKQDY